MHEHHLYSQIRFAAAPPEDIPRGIMGWVSFTMDGSFRVDGVAVRRTLDGRHALSFPARRDARGEQHFYLRPLTDAARRDIEEQVFVALGIERAPP